jgi:pyridoxamine 5'-phosphate oxidase
LGIALDGTEINPALEAHDNAPYGSRTMSDPFQRFDAWFSEARASGLPWPEALALGTVGPDGAPSVRMVLLKGVDPGGWVFYTNTRSRKGQELRDNPRAALCFYWPTLERQVRVEGLVESVTDAEADAYFASRPRGSQVGAWASAQSEPLDSREALLARVEAFEARFQGQAVPRPPYWSGYRLVPTCVEFWQGRPDRLHERTLYQRAGDAWTVTLLQP